MQKSTTKELRTNKEGTFLKPARGESQSSMTLGPQSDDSDSEDNFEADTQGVLGKGMTAIKEEDELEESEGSQYYLKTSKQAIAMKLRKVKENVSNNSINEVNEEEEETDNKEEDKEEEHKEQQDKSNHSNSSSDNSSDYYDDEEEDKIADIEPPGILKGKY